MEKIVVKNFPALFDDIFGEFFSEYWLTKDVYSTCDDRPARYYEDKETKETVIIVEAPAFVQDEIEVEVTEKGVSIKGELKDEFLKQRLGERNFSYLMKRNGVDHKTVKAKLENGILEVRFKEKDKVTKKIEVK